MTSLAEVLHDSGEVWSVGEPASNVAVQRLAAATGAPVPDELDEFLRHYGTIECGAIRICGLGAPMFSPADAIGALAALHDLLGEAATGLFPIESRSGGRFAVMDGRGVVAVVGRDNGTAANGSAPGLAEYVRRRVETHWERQLADLEELRVIGQRFGERHGLKTQGATKTLPSSQEERPLRFCIQDHRLTGFSLRFDRRRNGVVVGPTVFADAAGAPLRTGAEAFVASILSEAYRTGGSREIVFRRGLPDEVFRLAEDLGVSLARTDMITEPETRALLFALSGIGAVLASLDLPASLGELVARHVLAGTWTSLEAEALLHAGPAGQRVVVGGSPAEWRLARTEELEVGRAARLAQSLAERLERPDEVRQATNDGSHRVGNIEDSLRGVELALWPAGPPCAFVVRAREPFSIDWGVDGTWTLNDGESALVLARGRSRAAIAAHVERDLAEAAELRGAAGTTRAAVLYARDVVELDALPAGDGGACILAAPSPLIELDRLISGRLRRFSEDGE